MFAIYLNPFRLIKKLENFGFLEMSKQFIVSIILRNVAVAAIAARLAAITAHVVIIVAIEHVQYCSTHDIDENKTHTNFKTKFSSFNNDLLMYLFQVTSYA